MVPGIESCERESGKIRATAQMSIAKEEKTISTIRAAVACVDANNPMKESNPQSIR